MQDKDSRGFTLLEVLVSVAIIALVFISLLRMQASAISLAAATRFVTVSPVLAGRILSEIDADLKGFVQTHGDFGDAYPGFQWECTISNHTSDALVFLSDARQESLRKIEILITSPSGHAPYKMTTWRVDLD